MNANELADLIGLLESEAKTTARIDDFIKKSAAAMLRQLQKQHDSLALWVKEYQDKVDELRAEIEALKRPNNVVGVPSDKLAEMQAQLAGYKQVLESIANSPVELSNDKIKWKCEDHIRWAKEALKMTSDEGSMKSPCVQAGHPYNRAS